MINFVRLKENDRIFLFKKVKKKCNNWESLYPRLGISRSMLFNYIKGRYLIPEKLFFKLKKMSGANIKYVILTKEKYLKKEIEFPKMTAELAEIMGILNGDGHISKTTYEICVVGNILELDYFKYLRKLFEKNFKLKFKIQKQYNSLKLRAYSKELFSFLTNNYNLPCGNKMNNLSIPPKIFARRAYKISYIRGLFDTDGSFYLRRKHDPVIEISSADNYFLNQIKDLLISMELDIGRGTNKVFIYNKKDIYNFFNKIKPHNSKHLKKYRSYLNL